MNLTWPLSIGKIEAVLAALFLACLALLIYSWGVVNGLGICSQELAQAALELKIKAMEPTAFNFTGIGGGIG